MDETREWRDAPFTFTRSDAEGDGLTLEGYAAVFDSPTEINGREGHFIERIKPGAFARSLGRVTPKLMFNHGQHGLIGEMPIGQITEAREDARGLFIRAQLHDNWLVQPVRDAIRSGSIDGMSFRFSVPKGGDTWRAGTGLRERDVTAVNCSELGPVVFPAYADTEVTVRSQVAEILADPEQSADLSRALFACFAAEERADTTPYGDTAYADPGYKADGVKRYPINTAAHVRAAWSYINMPKNQEGYTSDQIDKIKARIKAAAKRFGVTISDMMAGSQMHSSEQDGDFRILELEVALAERHGESVVVFDATDDSVEYQLLSDDRPVTAALINGALTDERADAPETEPAVGPSDSPGMNDNDLPAGPSLNPDQKERRRQGLRLVAHHYGVDHA